ncbi:MAG: hypothetical protein OEY94_03990 [Alphaproteobacteria bacterium]|nr:hypothetical protein [Alphaproteobacteria bacterium]
MDNIEESETKVDVDKESDGAKPSPDVVDYLAGEEKDFVSDLSPYLPQDLIGGSVPHVPGMEEETVWNAATQACGTEKVHYTYVIDGKKIWYLACPSAAFASNPDSWCPLAAALPGNSEYWDKETVYLYEQEGIASALRWDPETHRIQVYVGASRTILPRVQSMDANFVTINPASADIVPWKSKMLKTEKLSRAVVRMLIFSGLVVNLLAVLILLVNLVSIEYIKADLIEVKNQSDRAASDLLKSAANVMQSDTIRHMVRIQDLLDSLTRSNAYLVRYEVNGTQVEWEAIAPQAFADNITRENNGAQVIRREDGDQVRIMGKR